MNNQELKENQILCLKQLRLSKWQAFWNKEFELVSLEKLDKDAIEKAEISGKLQPEQLKAVKNKYAVDVQTRNYEMSKLQMEISMLNIVIDQLEKPATAE